MKRIIITVTNDINNDQRMIRIADSLLSLKYEVIIVGRSRSDSPELTKQNFRQHRFRLWFEKGKLFYIQYNIRLFFYLLFHRFDIVYSVDLDSLLPGWLVARIKRKKIIYDAHEYFTELPELEGRPFTKNCWELIGKICVPRVDAAITVSFSLAEEFEKKYKQIFSVVRNVPLYEEVRFIPKAKKIILYQGVINKGRGIIEMLDALTEIDAEFLIAGRGDITEEVKLKIEKLQLQDKVHLLGNLDPVELKKITEKAAIGLNLLDSSSKNYYFSLANKFFDYVQAAIPSICMNFPEYEKLNREFEVSILIPDFKKETLCDAVNKLLADEKFYHTLQGNCLQAAKQWCWQEEGKKIGLIFEGG